MLVNNKASNNLLLAVVGMPGAGKSEATAYLDKKGYPFIRFGQLTDDGLSEEGLEINPKNERSYREKIRKELGMAAYAIKAKSKIEDALKNSQIVVLDGLYSWEEYKYLSEEGFKVVLISVFASPEKRYERLGRRAIRPVVGDEARARDMAEIERLNKGGPIAIADYLIVNNEDDMKAFYSKIDSTLQEIIDNKL